MGYVGKPLSSRTLRTDNGRNIPKNHKDQTFVQSCEPLYTYIHLPFIALEFYMKFCLTPSGILLETVNGLD